MTRLLPVLSLLALLGCNSVTNSPSPTSPAKPASSNPLLAPWSGPFGGLPPLASVRIADFKPALESAMAENLAEIDAIANDKAAPNFENTIAAMEKAGRSFARVRTVFDIYQSTMSTPEFQAVENEMAPKLSEFGDKIVQNEKLFARIAAVYATRERSKLTSEQQRLVWLDYSNFVHAGAKLDAQSKARMTEINSRLASLFASFNQNVMADENGYVMFLEQESDLAGLPDSVKSAAAANAESRGKPGQWAILNTRSSMDPFLTYSDRRDLREKVWRNFYSRGNNGDSHDTKQLITQILELRAERAKLLGFASHAHWRLDQSMAKTPEATLKLMEDVWKPAVARVHEEVADMQALSDKEGAGITIEGWDYRYYAEKVRKAKYDLDQNAMTPYLQLDKMRDALFYTAKRLFGLEFKPLSGIATVVPEEQVYEVTDANGKHVGLWYFDPYARNGKRSGAWMNAYRNQERFDQPITTIVSNNTNFVKGTPGQPVLISWDDATTMFHEFGHALHGLLSNVDYPSLSGTAVFTDYVEFPSQVLEHWVETPEVLNQFALHYQTGQPMPHELVEKIERASTFNQGFATVEYLSAALVDMKLHLAATPDKPIDPAAFERDTLAELGMPKEIVMRHRTTQFLHLFADDGYAAGYYCYLWSDTLAADAWEAFVEAGSPWDPATAKKLKEHVFSVGNTVDPAEGYRAFRGRDPGTSALMRKRGFPVK
ncbi:MAG: M3 family metallopeptidase [Planctomycetes bacterium]|nr:M3 family metallopeptidase [Planctomycetota bacterium]